MSEYRAYRIKNEHIDGVPVVITCDDDNVAIEQAKRRLSGHYIEVWDGARLVAGIKSTETTEAAGAPRQPI